MSASNLKSAGHTPSFIVLAIALALFVASCSGGGAALPAPNPNPQQQPPPQNQQQPPLPGQQQLPTAKAALVDSTKVVAIFDDQTMQFWMSGGAGAALPGASLVIEDPQSSTATGQAGQDGAFEFYQSDVPPNFMTAPGTVIEIYQFDESTLRSDAATVTIKLPGTP